MFLLVGSEVKASASNAGDLGSIPGLGTSPGEGNGNPLQYSCLENPVDGGAWSATVHRVTKSRTRLSDFTLPYLTLPYVPSLPAFWRVFFLFIINGYWILSKALSASIEMIIWLLFFNLLMWCITLIDLWILKNPCIPGIKPTWSFCMIFLMCCWIMIARILLRIFHLCSSVLLACSFFCGIFVWFWY